MPEDRQLIPAEEATRARVRPESMSPGNLAPGGVTPWPSPRRGPAPPYPVPATVIMPGAFAENEGKRVPVRGDAGKLIGWATIHVDGDHVTAEVDPGVIDGAGLLCIPEEILRDDDTTGLRDLLLDELAEAEDAKRIQLDDDTGIAADGARVYSSGILAHALDLGSVQPGSIVLVESRTGHHGRWPEIMVETFRDEVRKACGHEDFVLLVLNAGDETAEVVPPWLPLARLGQAMNEQATRARLARAETVALVDAIREVDQLHREGRHFEARTLIGDLVRVRS